MRPGSSMIEVQAFGFDEHIPHLQDPLFNHEVGEGGVRRRGVAWHSAALLDNPRLPAYNAALITQTLTPRLPLPPFPVQDKESEVLWWVLMGCDPDAWRPSPAEAARKADPGSWVKNRSMYVRWEALEAALHQVSQVPAAQWLWRGRWGRRFGGLQV